MPFGDVFIGVIGDKKRTKMNKIKWVTNKKDSDSNWSFRLYLMSHYCSNGSTRINKQN